MKSVTRRILLTAVLGALPTVPHQAQTRFTSFAEVRNVLSRLADVLPPELKVPNASDAERAWIPWAERQDRAIRSRLQRGDEETIVNWVLFGTTFTRLPRVPLDAPGMAVDESQRAKLIAARIVDLANVASVLGIQTEDLAIRHGREFVLLGRARQAEPRGCSLLALDTP